MESASTGHAVGGGQTRKTVKMQQSIEEWLASMPKKKRPGPASKVWTEEEIEKLKAGAGLIGIADLAAYFKCCQHEIRRKMRELGLTADWNGL